MHWQSTHQGQAGSWLGPRLLQLLPPTLSEVFWEPGDWKSWEPYRKVPKPWKGAKLKHQRLQTEHHGVRSWAAGCASPTPTQLFLHLKWCRVRPQEPQMNSLLSELSHFMCQSWEPWLSSCAGNPGCTDTEIHWEISLQQECLFLSYA